MTDKKVSETSYPLSYETILLEMELEDFNLQCELSVSPEEDGKW